MRTEMRGWIEGKGIMSAVFRALALWEYSTEEQARKQLVKALEKGNHPPGPIYYSMPLTGENRRSNGRFCTFQHSSICWSAYT